VRTVYLGTSEFAVTVLERLARSEHRPVLVVTRPNRPRGRGRRLAAPPVAEAARALGIDVAQPERINEPAARERIAAARPDVVAICAYGALIGEPLLSEHEMLNVHPSLLPRWRGAAPIERAIEAGDAVTGVSIMRPTLEMDAGPVCLAREEPIHPGDDCGTLSARLATLGGELLVEVLDTPPECVEQPSAGVTIAPKIGPDDRRLDPEERTATELERRVRALRPHVGTWLALPKGDGPSGEERLGVWAADVRSEDVLEAPPGNLVVRGERLLVACREGVLELLEVKPPGGRTMSAADWLHGRGAVYVRALAGDAPRRR
jgi:methionyl-tRNA formyltransferase